ncbi:hypothetical protein ACOMHN_018580 [Nucella lapillus]
MTPEYRTSCVPEAPKRSLLRGRRDNYNKPYWSSNLPSLHDQLSHNSERRNYCNITAEICASLHASWILKRRITFSRSSSRSLLLRWLATTSRLLHPVRNEVVFCSGVNVGHTCRSSFLRAIF